MEMYLAGVSVRRVEDITEALWGARVSAGTISNLNKKIYGSTEEWRNRPLEAEYPYIYMDGIWLKRSWGETVENGEFSFQVQDPRRSCGVLRQSIPVPFSTRGPSSAGCLSGTLPSSISHAD